jgi:eukaryotic-like serine/threonine-protein kinase
VTTQDDLTRLGSDDEPTPARRKLQPGHVFGPYRIVRELGSGGMGDVYEAEEIETGRRIALKTLSRAMGDREVRDRFLREGLLAASISHPNSVYVYGSYDIDGVAAITMELVGGGTLEAVVTDRGPMKPADAVETILQIIAGLEAAQARGILHRDIKPSNCFIDTVGVVKVGDYGLSLSIKNVDETRLTTAGMFLGTPAYASPEQIRGLTVDVRSDIYSVGATMYFLLTGRSPFEQANTMQMLAAVLTETPASPRKHVRDVPDALAAVVLRCLRKDPATRPASYAALRQALLAISQKTVRPAGRSRRLRAAFVDWLVLIPIRLAVATIGDSPGGRLIRVGADLLIYVAYFGWLEGRYGASLGKRLFGLRVVAADGTPAGLARASARAAVWALILVAPELVDVAMPSLNIADGIQLAVSLIVMFAGARRRNGDRGTHELASGTRTVAAARSWEGNQAGSAIPVVTRDAGATDSRVGGYAVRHRVWERDEEALDQAWDTTLDRGVWIHHRKAGTAALPDARQALARRTRLRWLASRRSDEEAWDAFEAPDGGPLGVLSPDTTVTLLNELAAEFQSALADGTAISPVTVDQVWVTSDGSVRLTEFPIVADASVRSASVSDVSSTQTFLYAVAVRALGGKLAEVALPLSQRAAVDTLERGGFKSFDDITDGLVTVRGLPAQVSRRRRLASLTGGFFMAAVLVLMGISQIAAAFALNARPDVEEAGRSFARLIYLEEPDEAEGTQWMSRNPSSRYTADERDAFKVYVGTHYARIIADEGAWDVIDDSFEGGDDLQQVARRARDDSAAASADVRSNAASRASRILDDLARRKGERGGFWLDLFYRLQTMVANGLGNLAPFALFWALVFRGSPILGLLNLGIAGPDGRRASWWRARWRSVLAWAPALAGYFALLWLERVDVHVAVVQAMIGVTNVVMIGGFILTAWKPERALQDHIAGTRIVPL